MNLNTRKIISIRVNEISDVHKNKSNFIIIKMIVFIIFRFDTKFDMIWIIRIHQIHDCRNQTVIHKTMKFTNCV